LYPQLEGALRQTGAQGEAAESDDGGKTPLP